MNKDWDIFCKVVDNFGDIGVCWRLARQLVQHHGLKVRLFVDDLHVASKIIPTLDFYKKSQLIDKIEVLMFNYEAKPARVVIEAFACGLPEAYQNQMIESTVWVNLEYLSAESWVDDFHGRNSNLGPLKRYFYFPGFTKKTGGLIREQALIESCDGFLSALPQTEDFKISLFCYPNAPINELFEALFRSQKTFTVIAPYATYLNQVAKYFETDSVAEGDVLTSGNLTLRVLPFMSQDDYDKLLWTCDLNFVRGEDSWVRAIWAGKPFVWQPYLQSDETHITKLNAFLVLFYSNSATLPIVQKIHLAWSKDEFNNEVWQGYLSQYTHVHTTTLEQSHNLGQQDDLATKLINFCENMHQPSS